MVRDWPRGAPDWRRRPGVGQLIDILLPFQPRAFLEAILDERGTLFIDVTAALPNGQRTATSTISIRTGCSPSGLEFEYVSGSRDSGSETATQE